ncbi:alpha-(1,3)-fucosyltransferase C-like [Haemaphysalis longicornis]
MSESRTRSRSSLEEPLERPGDRVRRERVPLNPHHVPAPAARHPPAHVSPVGSDASDDFRPFPPESLLDSCTRKVAFIVGGVIFFIIVASVLFYYLGLLRGRSDNPSGPVKPTSPWLPWRDRTDDVGVPRILVWNRPSSSQTSARTQWLWKTPRACSSESTRGPRRECEVTNDRDLLMKSDAILFHANHLNRADIPNWRADLQMWVFWVHTPLPLADTSEGAKSALALPDMARLFNWTTGHRDDADVKVPYRTWTCRNRTGRKTGQRATEGATAGQVNGAQGTDVAASNRMGTKKMDAAWILADCELNRFDQARNSRSSEAKGDVSARNADHPVYLRLFPACGAAQCTSPARCVRQIAQDYHFIIVSLTPECFSSAEELIYDAFEHDVVPVVLAPHDAVLNLPPNSVVTSSNLQGYGQLSGYLRSLLDDPVKYDSYFAWKQHCTVATPEDDLCPLCERLWEQPMRKGANLDALQWWTLRSRCEDEPLFGLDSTFELDI